MGTRGPGPTCTLNAISFLFTAARETTSEPQALCWERWWCCRKSFLKGFRSVAHIKCSSSYSTVSRWHTFSSFRWIGWGLPDAVEGRRGHICDGFIRNWIQVFLTKFVWFSTFECNTYISNHDLGLYNLVSNTTSKSYCLFEIFENTFHNLLMNLSNIWHVFANLDNGKRKLKPNPNHQRHEFFLPRHMISWISNLSSRFTVKQRVNKGLKWGILIAFTQSFWTLQFSF